ncbi:MAG: hypothetical protein JRG82_03495 [Deltaproteobacteria bacterium]|nr:hypothetical protein [Deltaproteobacteria bacterium]
MLRRFCAAYAAGALAALVASLVLWIAGRAEPRLVWGGLWALPYPWVRPRRLSAVQKGLLLSLAPSAAQLFWFMPEQNLGVLGQDLGTFTPAVVVLANATWGWVLARTFSRVGGGGGGGD